MTGEFILAIAVAIMLGVAMISYLERAYKPMTYSLVGGLSILVFVGVQHL